MSDKKDRREFGRARAIRFSKDNQKFLRQLAEAWGVTVSEAVRLCVASHAGLTSVSYGDYEVCRERGERFWRIRYQADDVADGLRFHEAIEKAQWMDKGNPPS